MMDMNEQVRELRETGTLVLTDPNGNKLFFVTSSVFKGKGLNPGLLIAYETSGSFYWDGEKNLNQFVLYQHGFSALVAPLVMAVVRGILGAKEAGGYPLALTDDRADNDTV